LAVFLVQQGSISITESLPPSTGKRYNPLSMQWQHLDGQDDLEGYYLGLMEESELALLDSPAIIRGGFDLFRLAWSLWGVGPR